MLAVGAWALAIVGWRRAQRERRPSWLLLLPVLYFNISLAFLLALGRYSVPVLPALLVLSAFGVDTLLDAEAAACADALDSGNAASRFFGASTRTEPA